MAIWKAIVTLPMFLRYKRRGDRFYALDYPDFDSLLKVADSIEAIRGEIDFEKDTLIYDLHVIDSRFLINQIDYAFEAWRTKPWASNLSFDNFCAMFCPIAAVMSRLNHGAKFFGKNTTTLTRPLLIRQPGWSCRQSKWWCQILVRFRSEILLSPTDQGLAEMMKTGLGMRGHDQSGYYAMRLLVWR